MNRVEAAAIARAAKAERTGPAEQRFWAKVDKRGTDECWPWTAAVRNSAEGYGAFWYERRHQPSNRMALVFSGTPVPAGMVACHACDNPGCCNPAHLFVGTPRQNNDDKVRKKRHAAGERHGSARLTREQVAEIRSLRQPGSRQVAPGVARQMAMRLGVTPGYVSELNKRGWREE